MSDQKDAVAQRAPAYAPPPSMPQPPISVLLSTILSAEDDDLKTCLAADLTAWMHARAILSTSGPRCTLSDLENLLKRFELTASMMRPRQETPQQFAPSRSFRVPLDTSRRGLDAVARELEGGLPGQPLNPMERG